MGLRKRRNAKSILEFATISESQVNALVAHAGFRQSQQVLGPASFKFNSHRYLSGIFVCRRQRAKLSASATALIMALALLTVSLNSYCGSLSATIPPPACTYAMPSFSSAVRKVMQLSRFPLKLK